MSTLNPIEKEARVVLTRILDLMGPGKRHMSNNEHTELMGDIRNCVHHLINKEYGCETGIHTGPCTCSKQSPGHHVCGSKAHDHAHDRGTNV